MRGLAVLALVIAPLAARAAEPAGTRAVVVIDSPDPGAWRRVLAELESRGARLPLRLPPDTLAGWLPAGLESALGEGPLAGVSVRREGAPAPPRRELPPNARAARRFLEPLAVPAGARRPSPLHGDAVEALPGEIPAAPKALPSGCDRPPGTSTVLVGSVAIGILLPESLGPAEDSEDWSAEDPGHPGEDRRDLVVAEILQGCAELVAEHPSAGLSFTFDVRRDVGIPLEPIEHAVPDRAGWIDATLSAIGFGSASSSAGTGAYVASLRERLGTEWAAAAYVADDLADADNGFPPTGFPFAYALLGGPYMVMTYDNDGWGIERMNVVFRHELGHVFGALDEYRSAGNSCGSTAGFLRVKNGNNDSGAPDAACVSAVACVMRANETTASCPFTNGQMGIRDADGDGILDVRDAPPDSGFQDASPLLVASADVTLAARSSARGRDDESDHAPVGFTLNRVAAAEARVDGGAWTPLGARDGGYGDRCEDHDVVLAGLAEGWHDVELRATNDLGLVEPTPASLRVYVNADCADDPSEPDDDASQAVARAAGAHALRRCAYDADWSRFFLQAGASVTVSIAQADPTGTLVVRLLDPAGGEIARAASAGGVATITAAAARRGVHFAAIEADSEFETDLTLTIVAACVDDADEPDAPAPLGRESYPGTLRARTLCAGDEDRYLVALQPGESLQADLAFDGAFGDLDLEVLDPSGAVAASSTGTGSAETAAVTPSAEGVHVVRVFGKTPSDRNAYDLTIAATGCVDDAGEDDDDPASARPIVAGDVVRGAACGDDEDWLGLDVTARRLVRLVLAHDPAAGNLDLELRTSDGRRVARSTRPGGVEAITSERLAPGSYAVRIAGTSAARVGWTLSFEDVDPLLLFVAKDPEDALLRWYRSGQECFTLRRSDVPSDFTGATRTLVQEGDPTVPDGDRPVDDLGWRDRGAITDGVRLHCYLVDPHDCGASLVGSLKSVEPYPVVLDGIGSLPALDWTVVVRNDGAEDAFGVSVLDDMPPEIDTFTVTEIPPGATDASSPPPAGAGGRGQVLVTGMNVPSGQERIVRFHATISPRTTFNDPLIDNQAIVSGAASPVEPPRSFLTDDGLTSAFGDDTRVLHAGFAQQLLVHAFWHREVDLDLAVTDPCGNVVGAGDMPLATCAGLDGRVMTSHSCAAPSAPTRYERLGWGGFPPPAAEYVVSVSYPGFAPDDPACGGFGPEEVTVVVQRYGVPPVWRTITIEPGADHVEVLRFVI